MKGFQVDDHFTDNKSCDLKLKRGTSLDILTCPLGWLVVGILGRFSGELDLEEDLCLSNKD